MYVPVRGIVIYDWTGLYAGLHLGGAWADTGAYDNQEYNRIGDAWGANSSGFVAGGQLGYNWQVGWLMGLEGDIGDLGLNGNGASHFAATNFDTSSATDADFYITARGRLGIVADHRMIYGTGGFMGADMRVSITRYLHHRSLRTFVDQREGQLISFGIDCRRRRRSLLGRPLDREG